MKTLVRLILIDTVILIAVRMKSSRLKKKALKKIEGVTILEHLVERMKLVKNAQSIIVCTSTNSQDDEIYDLCISKDYKCFRGSEKDVMGRFLNAVKDINPKNVVRVTGDNCLVSYEFLQEAIDYHNQKDSDYTTTENLPRGMRGEVISHKMLKRLHDLVEDPDSSEYMTWMLDRPDIFKVNKIKTKSNLMRKNYRVTCDTKKDLELLKIVYKNLYKGQPIPSQEVIKFLDENPEVVAINSKIKQKLRQDVEVNVKLKVDN